MKFRILEVKLSHQRERYYPQYKKWFFWRNIRYHYFCKTIYNKTEFPYEYEPYVFSIKDAQKIIEEFKKYIEDEKCHSCINQIQ